MCDMQESPSVCISHFQRIIANYSAKRWLGIKWKDSQQSIKQSHEIKRFKLIKTLLMLLHIYYKECWLGTISGLGQYLLAGYLSGRKGIRLGPGVLWHLFMSRLEASNMRVHESMRSGDTPLAGLEAGVSRLERGERALSQAPSSRPSTWFSPLIFENNLVGNLIFLIAHRISIFIFVLQNRWFT